MPIFLARMTVLANVAETSPTIMEISPNVGYIEHVQIAHATTGVAFQVGVQLLDRGSRIAPAPGSSEAFLTAEGDAGGLLEWDEDYMLSSPYRLRIAAYNVTASSRILAVRVTMSARPWRRDLAELADAAALWKELTLARSSGRAPSFDRWPDPGAGGKGGDGDL